MINQAFKNPGVQAYDVPEILPDGTREDYELGNVRITITQPREDRYSPKRVLMRYSGRVGHLVTHPASLPPQSVRRVR